MATYRMTAARKAALRKAQLASARKRKGKKRSASRTARRAAIRKESARRRSYATKNYRKPGGIYKANKDRWNSTGYYSRNYKGKAPGRIHRGVNKGITAYGALSGTGTAILAGSYARGRRAGTIKRRKKRR